MTWVGSFYRSAIGKKAIMAVTGVILFGFVLAHMIGNLKLYYGEPTHMNEYGAWLRTIGMPALPQGGALWIMRALLLAAVILHIHAAYALTRMNAEARPVAYRERGYLRASYAARTMRWGGVIILLFVIYHILHFTTGQAHPSFIPEAPYENAISGFQVWWVSAFYIVANLALGFHLHHGLWSMFASLGWTSPKYNPLRRNFATTFAVVITAANISFPLAVLTGFLR